MATANGALSPPADSLPNRKSASPEAAEKKRKREEDETLADVLSGTAASRDAQTQKDILDILKQYDPEPSFINHTLEHKSTNERSPKKARLSDPGTSDISISSKLAIGAYTTLQDLRKDAERVSEGMVAAVRDKAKDREGQNAGRVVVDDLKQMQRIQAFEQVIKDVVDQENRYEAMHGQGTTEVKQEPSTLTNGHTGVDRAGAGNRQSTVLTLFGNAPTPKQLFSSMQHAPRGPTDRIVTTELPVEEMSLPNGLTATKILPVPADGSKGAPTFEDAFPPAYNLPALQPPKSQKRPSTRDSTITWEFKDPLARGSKKGGYTTQSLPVGDWLGYGGVDARDEPSSPREKRKLRDRALSSGEGSLPPPSRASLESALAKEEEALFRRAYSSFAPSCDNSRSLVSDETKNMVWWHKVGHKRYDETFAIDPALLDERPTPISSALPFEDVMDTTEDDFERVIEEMEELDESLEPQPVHDKTEVGQVLLEISELIKTLASYQRIRTSSLPTSVAASRTPISPAPTLASRIGRPDSPAEDEVTTYFSLRREIAYLILKLPPYAVAKLDSDQLSELGVRKLITFQSKDTKGTLEEDQVARHAKYTAMATAAGIATLTRNPSNGSQHYSSTNQRTPAIGQAANTRYGQQYGAGRTPLSQPQFARSISNQSTYGTPSTSASRPGYGQPNQYSRPGATSNTFGQTNGQHYFNRQPLQTFGSYGQQYGQSTPGTQQRPTYASSQPLAQYQQRSQAATQNAGAYQTNSQSGQPPLSQSPFNRTASPIKPAGYPQPVQPNPSPRPLQQGPFQPPQQQPGSGRATPVSYPSQPQTPVNGLPPPRPVAPRAASGTPQPPASAQGSPPHTQPVQTNGHDYDDESDASILVHTGASTNGGGQKEWLCEYCGKSSNRHSTYVVHLRTHTGERPYICPVAGCGRDFAVRSNLTRHVKATHKGDAGALEGLDDGEDEEGIEEEV